MTNVLAYILKVFADKCGAPSSKRYACALFAITGVVLAALGYNAEIVAIFVIAAVGENITSIFEKGK